MHIGIDFGTSYSAAAIVNGELNLLIESPRSMFGYRLDPQVRKVIVHIATHILEHIRLTASRQFGSSAVRHAGAPVRRCAVR